MVAVRDLKCSMEIAEMAALGWFAEEFIVYGCCYVENGKLYYKVSSQNTELYQFREEYMKKGIYVSPITELLNRVSVPSGMQDEYLLRTKIKLAKKMQQDYDSALMLKFVTLVAQNSNDSAAELLNELKKKLAGCFEREIIQLVESIVEYAFQQKKLEMTTYWNFCCWLDYIYNQMEDDVVIRRNFQRIFYGFAYRTNTGVLKFYANASEGEARKRKEALLCQGIRSTPILWKKYSFDSHPDLMQVKEEFLKQLAVWIDEEYISYLQQIDNLPTAVPTEQYQALMKQAEVEKKTAVLELLRYYKCLWSL